MNFYFELVFYNITISIGVPSLFCGLFYHMWDAATIGAFLLILAGFVAYDQRLATKEDV